MDIITDDIRNKTAQAVFSGRHDFLTVKDLRELILCIVTEVRYIDGRDGVSKSFVATKEELQKLGGQHGL